ncbi:hypothetical protein [Tahibacter amnicola]|uniref:Uncharacterized protein n=1 Tax=Tahibacter amnicola TaxID=2976241 RepID=A0ABY6BI72_9GAMM|nr:hypothetical protein [Tahibacter amnicola]UXI69711.1 hypothetical protein N4264_08785 [Tahibacter amnicola]
MYRLMVGLVVVLSGALMTGCASSGNSGLVKREMLPSDDIDVQKVATVNKWARERGHTVQWINMPIKTRDHRVADR